MFKWKLFNVIFCNRKAKKNAHLSKTFPAQQHCALKTWGPKMYEGRVRMLALPLGRGSKSRPKDAQTWPCAVFKMNISLNLCRLSNEAQRWQTRRMGFVSWMPTLLNTTILSDWCVFVRRAIFTMWHLPLVYGKAFLIMLAERLQNLRA